MKVLGLRMPRAPIRHYTFLGSLAYLGLFTL